MSSVAKVRHYVSLSTTDYLQTEEQAVRISGARKYAMTLMRKKLTNWENDSH